MELESIYAHDILPVSFLLEGEFPTKPNKRALIAELEKILKDDEYLFPAGKRYGPSLIWLHLEHLKMQSIVCYQRVIQFVQGPASILCLTAT